MEDVLFFEIAIVIVTAGVLSFLARLFRQPLIIAYIATGFIVGSTIFIQSDSYAFFDVLAKIGIAFLLFLVGLHLDWRSIKDVGKIAILSGLGQVIFTTTIGTFITMQLGFELVEAIFISIAFAFSSTIIIVKLLSDKGDLERLYGRVSVGFLIVQDLVAMFILLGLSAFNHDAGGGLASIFGWAVVKLVVVLFFLWLLARFVIPHVFHGAAHSQEQLFLITIAWCFALASGLTFIGFGIEIGALLAGISLASTGFRRQIESHIRPLRDFFLILFFIFLGTQLSLDSFIPSISAALILSAFILIGNPLIVVLILRIFGYHPRTGFLSGVTVAQISEFSFILLSSAILAGFVSQNSLSLATLVAMITITISSYLIKYNEEIYEKIEPLFRWLEHVPDAGAQNKEEPTPKVIVFGCDSIGRSILPGLHNSKESYLVVDIDPSVVDELEEEQIPHMYGDMANRDFLEYIRAQKAKLIISTIPDVSATVDMIGYMRAQQSKATIVATAKRTEDAGKLYKAGATFVIIPGLMSGELFAHMFKTRQLRKSSWKASAKQHQWVIQKNG